MKTLECSHATGEHDEACDLVAGLEAELKGLRAYVALVEDDNAAFVAQVGELRRCLACERCSVCGQRYSINPATGMGCRLADHIEAYEAIVGKVTP